ncbi:MAG: helix-turn-helix domain-containing protein [Dehalococcoidia bacterium]
MEEVTIQEASRRLNVSQDVIRSYVREGRLKGRRQTGEEGRSWVVELPEAGWQDDHKTHINDLAQQLTPWWWPNDTQTGLVHYVDSLGIEEVEPLFMCGLTSPDIWPAVGHTIERRCPVCIEQVTKLGMPMETRE